MPKQPEKKMDATLASMRVDKWLWVARFFKTRSLAKAAIEGGKVHHAGDRVKVSREIRVGMELSIMQGFEKKTVVIQGLAEQRGPAPVAQQLYIETEVSLARRELIAAQRKLNNLAKPDHKPSKRNRRMIHRFQKGHSQGHAQDHSHAYFQDDASDHAQDKAENWSYHND